MIFLARKKRQENLTLKLKDPASHSLCPSSNLLNLLCYVTFHESYTSIHDIIALVAR